MSVIENLMVGNSFDMLHIVKHTTLHSAPAHCCIVGLCQLKEGDTFNGIH